MDKIVFATTNEGKVKEIKEILAGFPIEVVSMKEMNITADIEESGLLKWRTGYIFRKVLGQRYRL